MIKVKDVYEDVLAAMIRTEDVARAMGDSAPPSLSTKSVSALVRAAKGCRGAVSAGTMTEYQGAVQLAALAFEVALWHMSERAALEKLTVAHAVNKDEP